MLDHLSLLSMKGLTTETDLLPVHGRASEVVLTCSNAFNETHISISKSIRIASIMKFQSSNRN